LRVLEHLLVGRTAALGALLGPGEVRGRLLGIVRGAVHLFSDASERERIAQALERSEASLTEAQRIAHVGSWDLDPVADTLAWSAEIYRIFEIDPREFGASYASFLDAVHPEDRSRVHEAYTRSVAERTPYDLAHRLLMSDGRVKYVHERGETFYDPEGRPLRTIGTVQDVTERRRAEMDVERLNAELEQRVVARSAELAAANHELEAFAYTVSHDLRTPLRHITAFAELLRRQSVGALDEEGKRYLTLIDRSAREMGTLIDDLLSFSALGRAEIERAPVDLGRLVADVVGAHREETANRDVGWRIGDLPKVSGDGHLLRLAIDNLVSNALKFTQTRTHAEIEIGAVPSPTRAVLFVRDNGVGFDMQYAEKLFQVFRRLHPKGEFEGTGIGLATVRRIVERHGGETWAEGRVDGGATFYLSLPDLQA
jgi:signal transduction histidine kinase